MNLVEKIVSVMKHYEGVEETTGNSGFKQTWFQALMVAVGWKKFESWCAYTVKSCWLESFKDIDPIGYALIKKYANGSCVLSYKAFKKSPEFKVRMYPVVGAIAYYGKGDPKTATLGHAGIVMEVKENQNDYLMSSGNTNKAGSREGTSVVPKWEKVDKKFNPTGLNLLGFVHPIRINA